MKQKPGKRRLVAVLCPVKPTSSISPLRHCSAASLMLLMAVSTRLDWTIRLKSSFLQGFISPWMLLK